MTVSTTDSEIDYTGNGITTAYPVPFRFLNNSDLVVTSVSTEGVSSTLTMGVDYTVIGAGAQAGGVIMMTAAPATGVDLNISRELEAVQGTDLRNQGRFYAETHENVFDYLTMLIQQGFSGLNRALKRPPGKAYFDAESRNISNLADPVLVQDAATRGWVTSFISGVSGAVNTTIGIAYDTGTLFDYLRFGVSRSVDTISDLRLLSTSRNQRAFVFGYYARGDGGGGSYFLDAADTTSADNGGTIIVAADSSRWKLANQNNINVRQFGAKGDGVTDDTGFFTKALASLGAKGGIVRYTERHLIDTTLTVPANCTLQGPSGMVGSSAIASVVNIAAVAALIVNSSATINLKNGSGIDGGMILRKGLVAPVLNSALFAGTAVTSQGDDTFLINSMVLGFNFVYDSNTWGRPRIHDVFFDCNNGIRVIACLDTGYVSRCHGWPFLTQSNGGDHTALERSGVAFSMQSTGDWNKLTDCFSFGYMRGYQIVNCNSITLLSCSADGTGQLSGSIGIEISGACDDTRLVATQTAGQNYGIRIATNAGQNTTIDDANVWSCQLNGISVDSGDVTIKGTIRDQPNHGIQVNSVASHVHVYASKFRNVLGNAIRNDGASPYLTTSGNDYGDYPPANPAVLGSLAPTIASADPLNLPQGASEVYNVSGTNNFNNLGGGYAGRRATLIFGGVLTVADGGNLRLSANFTSSADDTLSLVHNGSAWFETSRSIN